MQAGQYPATLLGVDNLKHGTSMYVKSCMGPRKMPFQVMTVPSGSPVPVRLASRPDLCVVHFSSKPTVGESRIMLANCTGLDEPRAAGWTLQDPSPPVNLPTSDP